MANETKKVQNKQIPTEEPMTNTDQPVENPVLVEEPTENPEDTKKEDVKEENITMLRRVANWADAKDKKHQQKKAEKQKKLEQKKLEKEAKKAEKPEATLGSKIKS